MQKSAKTNSTLMEQAIHNAARDSLEAIERGKKKAKHTTGNKKLGQIIKARRVTIKQRNRILHTLINKQNLTISFKLPPTTNKYCQSIPIYSHNTSKTPTENQTQIAISWTYKMEEVIRTLTGKANKIKKKFRHRNINKAIKKINKKLQKERNFWAKVSNRTQKEEPITSVALLNNKISNKFEKIIEGFTQFWEKLYSGHIQKLDNIWQEWYSREDLTKKPN